jgi:hypothetical protein
MKRLLFVFAAVCGIAAGAAANPPNTDPIWGTNNDTDRGELKAWGAAFWARAIGGDPVDTAPFTNPDLNKHTFNPLHGTRATLERLKLIDPRDTFIALAAYEGNDPIANKRKTAVHDALTDSSFKTSIVDNPRGTMEHIAAILDSSRIANVATYCDGNYIKSENLPLDIVVAAGASPEVAEDVSDTNLQLIAAIAITSPGLLAQCPDITIAQAWVTGTEPTVESFADKIRQVVANFNQSYYVNVSTIEAHFGVYGSLPVVAVQLSDSEIYVSAITGNVLGPVKLGGRLSLRPLVQELFPGTTVGGITYFLAQTGTPGKGAAKVPKPHPEPPPNWPSSWPLTRTYRSSKWACVTLQSTNDNSDHGQCQCKINAYYGLLVVPPDYPTNLPTVYAVQATCNDGRGPCQRDTYDAPPALPQPICDFGPRIVYIY